MGGWWIFDGQHRSPLLSMCRLYQSVKEPKCHRLLVSADWKRLPQSAICHVSGHPSHLSHPAKLARTRTWHTGFLCFYQARGTVARSGLITGPWFWRCNSSRLWSSQTCVHFSVRISPVLRLAGNVGTISSCLLSECGATPWTSRLFMNGATKTIINPGTF